MGKRISVFKEMALFLKQNKAYWMIPIFLMLLVLMGLVMLGAIGGGAAAPFIYSLF